MRLSWVIQVVHKYSYICFYKTEADGELTTQTQNRRNPHDQRERLERFSYKPMHAGSFQRLKEEWVSNLLCPAKNYWFTIHLQYFFSPVFLYLSGWYHSAHSYLDEKLESFFPLPHLVLKT